MNMKTLIKSLTLAFAFAFTFAFTSAFAQDKPNDEGWQKVDSGMMQTGESIPASRLVSIAYGFIFASVVVFAVSIAVRTRRVEDDMDDLRRKLEQKGK
jgi:hypothetical protein